MSIRKQPTNIASTSNCRASKKEITHTYKNFLIRYQTEYSIFSRYIKGFTDNAELNKYAALMHTRLMFLYFLQDKNFLDNDPNYLSNHLKIFQNNKGASNSDFYHDFFLILLFKGLSDPRHLVELSAILGHVPFLDIDLFKESQIERDNVAIRISNEAFESLFAFFNSYRWQMSGDSSNNKNVITPDIFSFIFEKSINQKQLGAFYTQEDITEYIAKSTIIPYLFNSAEKKYPDPFQGGDCIWQVLRNNIDRYIYPAVKKGVELPLPIEIEKCLSDVSRRNNWNKLASDAYALPTETWREVIARRQHYHEIRNKLASDTAHSIDEIITYNIDIRQLTQDVIERCEDFCLLQAFYESILKLSVLDPTCGTGAFLLAALDMLVPLYTTCLDRLKKIEPVNSSGEICSRERYYQFPNRTYAVIKSLITSNLYGVDIMEEAIEVCKIRLLLKLLAQIDRPEEIEPLPNLDSQIRTGNALPGFTNQLRDTAIGCENSHDQIDLTHLTLEAQSSHLFVEHSAMMPNGGFDVIIGNPPYIVLEKVNAFNKLTNFMTSASRNMHALIIECCVSLLVPGGRFGMIVPASATCTDGYLSLQEILLEQSTVYVSSFSDQRGKLFDIPHPRLCIISFKKEFGPKRVFTTPYIKLERKIREYLFQRLKFIEVTEQVLTGIIPRYGSLLEQSLNTKLHNQSQHLGHYLCKTGTHPLFFTRKLSWFVQVTPFIPRILDAQDRIRKPSELKTLHFPTSAIADIAFVALNSNLFYWFLTTRSDCRNLNMREAIGFPLDVDEISPSIRKNLREIAKLLIDELQANSEMRRMSFKDTGLLTIQCFFPGKSKTLIDKIDLMLAQHYGFSEEELDFIVNYDIKYRAGRNLDL
jgi:Eco57I restriction-modification methylase